MLNSEGLMYMLGTVNHHYNGLIGEATCPLSLMSTITQLSGIHKSTPQDCRTR
jgi:hypothetical protein